MPNTPQAQALVLAVVAVSIGFLAACTSEPSTSESNETGSVEGTFGEALGMDGARYLPLADVDEAVQQLTTIVSGEVEDLVEGRREMLDDGSDPEFYARHVDIVIRPSEIMKGEGSTNTDVHVEFIWPRNLATDELSEALPRGAQAIVLGGPPDGAEETAYTLLQVPPYGLVFETESGDTQLPFDGDREFHEALSDGQAMSFDELHGAISNAASP